MSSAKIKSSSHLDIFWIKTCFNYAVSPGPKPTGGIPAAGRGKNESLLHGCNPTDVCDNKMAGEAKQNQDTAKGRILVILFRELFLVVQLLGVLN
ncbi:MAG: hypothetical protein ACLRVT_09985, partial [Oscillospiraceae bacterium]